MYYLGDEYEGVYFTKREAECLLYLVEGNTIVKTALIMGLSPRTVEFYVKNMKMKIGVTTKVQLLQRIERTDFMKNYHISTVTMGSSPNAEKDAIQ